MTARLVWEKHRDRVVAMFARRFKVHMYGKPGAMSELGERYTTQEYEGPPLLNERNLRRWMSQLPSRQNVVVWGAHPSVVCRGKGKHRRYALRLRFHTAHFSLRRDEG